MTQPIPFRGVQGRLAATHPMLAAPRRLAGLALLAASLGLTSVLVLVQALFGLFR